jgi:N-acetylglucosaminyl-diphospho-decaprenol L-rhamnosyltransferase
VTGPGQRDARSAPAPVAVVVVSYETRELLRRCLASLAGDVGERRADVWVVDNGSRDGSPELVRSEFAWATLVPNEDNLGFGKAVNLGARAATAAEWIAPANADIALESGALSALLEAGARDPGAGVIAPRLIQPDGTTQHSVHSFPTLGFTLLYNARLQRVRPAWGDRACLEGYWDPDRERRVPWAVGAFVLVRRAAWDAAGGFDERQWMYAEDLDLAWRADHAGWPTRYEPAARVHHEVSAATAQAWGDARTERWMRATYAWMEQRRGVPLTRAVAAINVCGDGGRWLLRVPAARLRADRWAGERDEYRAWARMHAIGLRPSSREDSGQAAGTRDSIS